MQHGTNTNNRTARVMLALAGTALLFGSVAATGDTGRPTTGPDDRLTEDIQFLIEDLIESRDSYAEAQGGDELELETVKFFIEFNETDEDIGVQSLIGGEPYKLLRAYGPNEKKILDMRPRRGLRQQGMSDFFFESAEPTLDEFSMEEFLDRFPEGEYEFETRTLDGLEQEGETMLTHLIPAGPEITSPEEGDVVDVDSVVVEWEPVTMTTAFNPPQVPVTIVGYQVILTREDPLRVLSMDVSADTTSVAIPSAFLDPGTEYEIEVLAVEESDNQTISIIFFETAE